MKIHPEVLIYVQKVKAYFENASNKDKEYFYTKDGADMFFHNLEEIAIKNFEENGRAELTPHQFEGLKVVKNNKFTFEKGDNFINYLNIGIIYLN